MWKLYIAVLVGLPFTVAAALWYARRRFELRALEGQLARKRHADPTAEAIAILNQRLAKGEISPDEYKKLRSVIQEGDR
jgi:uncharacterized membrane protein